MLPPVSVSVPALISPVADVRFTPLLPRTSIVNTPVAAFVNAALNVLPDPLSNDRNTPLLTNAVLNTSSRTYTVSAFVNVPGPLTVVTSVELMSNAGEPAGNVKSLASVRLPRTVIRPDVVGTKLVPVPSTVVVPALRFTDIPDPTLNTPLASVVSVPEPL